MEKNILFSSDAVVSINCEIATDTLFSDTYYELLTILL